MTSLAFSAGHNEKALGLSLLKEGMQLTVWTSYHFSKLVFSEPRVKFLTFTLNSLVLGFPQGYKDNFLKLIFRQEGDNQIVLNAFKILQKSKSTILICGKTAAA